VVEISLLWHNAEVQLYEIIKAYKRKYESSIFDGIMAANDHTLLWLPYHADLNPRQLIWEDVEQWVGANNTTFSINDAKRLLKKLEQKSRSVFVNM
jgi:hypothetical protein